MGRHDTRKQEKRINRVIEWLAARSIQKKGENNEKMTFRYKKLCVLADANYASMSGSSHMDKLDTYNGIDYIFGKGIVELQPQKILKHRKKLDKVEEIASKTVQEHVNEVEYRDTDMG